MGITYSYIINCKNSNIHDSNLPRILILGCQNTGKTRLFKSLESYELKLPPYRIAYYPTIGFEKCIISSKNWSNEIPIQYFTLYDIGGMPQIRSWWNFYFKNVKCIFYVIDRISSFVPLEEQIICLNEICTQLPDTPIAILDNLIQPKNLTRIPCRLTKIKHVAINAFTLYGMNDVFTWLLQIK